MNAYELTSSIVKIKYEQLRKLVDESSLVPGCFYQIIDYVTTTNYTGDDSLSYRSFGNRFDIIVQALSESKLSENAKATHHVYDSNYEKRYRLYKTDEPDYPDLIEYYEYNGSETKEIDGNSYHFWSRGNCSQDDGYNLGVIKDGGLLIEESVDNLLALTGYSVLSSNITVGYWRSDSYDNEYSLSDKWTVCRVVDNSVDYFKNNNLEAWELKYTIYNDRKRFSWAEDQEEEKTRGYGVIYYMKDEFGNEAPYDFKNIQFKRFEGDTDHYNSVNRYIGTFLFTLGDRIDEDKEISIIPDGSEFFERTRNGYWFYTFHQVDFCIDASLNLPMGENCDENDDIILYSGEICKNNVIKEYYTTEERDGKSYNILTLNDIVFCEYTYFVSKYVYSTWTPDHFHGCFFSHDNYIGENCYKITFFDAKNYDNYLKNASNLLIRKVDSCKIERSYYDIFDDCNDTQFYNTHRNYFMSITNSKISNSDNNTINGCIRSIINECYTSLLGGYGEDHTVCYGECFLNNCFISNVFGLDLRNYDSEEYENYFDNCTFKNIELPSESRGFLKSSSDTQNCTVSNIDGSNSIINNWLAGYINNYYDRSSDRILQSNKIITLNPVTPRIISTNYWESGGGDTSSIEAQLALI